MHRIDQRAHVVDRGLRQDAVPEVEDMSAPTTRLAEHGAHLAPLPLELPRAAVRAGAHWLDISDVAGWVLSIVDDAELDHQASESDVCVIPGSSVRRLSIFNG